MSAKQSIENFWSRIEIKTLDACWEWTGGTNNTGYGTASWHGVTYTAHRIAAWSIGLIESPQAPIDREGTGFILHSCDNRLCCNPTHLNVGTYTENQLEAYSRGRRTQPKGSKHSNAKLSDTHVKEIRASMLTQDRLAKKYNVSQRVISLVKRNETYKEVIC